MSINYQLIFLINIFNSSCSSLCLSLSISHWLFNNKTLWCESPIYELYNNYAVARAPLYSRRRRALLYYYLYG